MWNIYDVWLVLAVVLVGNLTLWHRGKKGVALTHTHTHTKHTRTHTNANTHTHRFRRFVSTMAISWMYLHAEGAWGAGGVRTANVLHSLQKRGDAVCGCKLSVSLKPAALSLSLSLPLSLSLSPPLYGRVIPSVKMCVPVNVRFLAFLSECECVCVCACVCCTHVGALHILTIHSWSINTAKGKTIYFQMENYLNYSQLNHWWINEHGYWYPRNDEPIHTHHTHTHTHTEW